MPQVERSAAVTCSPILCWFNGILPGCEPLIDGKAGEGAYLGFGDRNVYNCRQIVSDLYHLDKCPAVTASTEKPKQLWLWLQRIYQETLSA
jgi:hypothetical protein